MIRDIILDRMAWFLDSEMDATELAIMLRMELTLATGDDGYAPPTEIYLYERKDGMTGVPRQFAAKKWGKMTEIEDATVCPAMLDCPEFQGTLRPDQEIAVADVLAAFDEPRGQYGGLIEGKCGSGKTVVGIAIAALMKTPVLVLVHKNDLMKQWEERINQFLPGARIGKVQQNVQSFAGRHITIGMMATLKSRKTELERAGFFKHFGMVIVDEGHHIPAGTFEKVIKLFHARYRLGLSATWRRKDGMEDVFYWHLGPMLTRIKAATVKGTYVQLGWKPIFKEREFKGHISTLITMLAEDVNRTRMICEEIVKAHDTGRRILVLTDRREHAEKIATTVRTMILKAGGLGSVGLYLGQMTDEALRDSRSKKIIVGSYGMFSEGTDVPEMDTLFLATPRKDIEQAVGRIQRPVEKRAPLVVDIVDSFGICIGLARARRTILKDIGFTKQGDGNHG